MINILLWRYRVWLWVRRFFLFVTMPIWVPLALITLPLWMPFAYLSYKRRLEPEVEEKSLDSGPVQIKDGLIIDGQHRLAAVKIANLQHIDSIGHGPKLREYRRNDRFDPCTWLGTDGHRKEVCAECKKNHPEKTDEQHLREILIQNPNLPHTEIARKLGKSTHWVTRRIKAIPIQMRKAYSQGHFVSPTKVFLLLTDAADNLCERIPIEASVYDACLQARKFQAKISANRPYDLAWIKLVDHCGKVIGSKQMVRRVDRGDVIDVTYFLRDVDLYYLNQEEPEMWGDSPIPSLDDGHLWNILQALKNGKWAKGWSVTFQPAIKKALLMEGKRRCFNDIDVQHFIERNDLWKEKRERPTEQREKRNFGFTD